MSFRKFEMENFCVAGRKSCATTKFVGDITSNGHKVLVWHCSNFLRETSMTVSGTTKQTEVLSDIFKNLGKKGLGRW